MWKSLFSCTAFILGLGAAAPAYATQIITFDALSEGAIAANQYSGVIFSGASVLTEASMLNAPYPPKSTPNVVYDFLDGTITLNFTVAGVTSIGGYITGNTNITESVFDGATLLGTVSTGGANEIGANTGLNPNIFLNFSGATITSAVFSNGEGFGNTFTLDNVTVGGANVVSAVPLPPALPMFGSALLGIGLFAFHAKQRTKTEGSSKSLALSA